MGEVRENYHKAKYMKALLKKNKKQIHDLKRKLDAVRRDIRILDLHTCKLSHCYAKAVRLENAREAKQNVGGAQGGVAEGGVNMSDEERIALHTDKKTGNFLAELCFVLHQAATSRPSQSSGYRSDDHPTGYICNFMTY